MAGFEQIVPGDIVELDFGHGPIEYPHGCIDLFLDGYWFRYRPDSHHMKYLAIAGIDFLQTRTINAVVIASARLTDLYDQINRDIGGSEMFGFSPREHVAHSLIVLIREFKHNTSIFGFISDFLPYVSVIRKELQ